MTLPQPDPPREIEIRAIFAVLRRQIRVIAMTTGVIFAAAGLFLLVATETFTASALVLVDPDQKGILDDSRNFPSSSGRENAKVDSEVEILRSDALALSVIREKGLMADPEFGLQTSLADKLARAVGVAIAAPDEPDRAISRTLNSFKQARTVRRKGLTYLISVSASSNSPQKAADLANALAQTYIDRQVSTKVSALLKARNVLRDQMEAARKAIADHELGFDRFIANNLALMDADASSADISRLSTRLQLLEAERSALLESAPDQPAPGEAGLLTAGARQDGAPAAENADETQQRLRQIDTDISGLRQTLRRSVLSADLSPDMLTGLYTFQQNANIAREQYQGLLSKMSDLETRAKIQIADSRIVSPAIAPVQPTFPNRNLVLLLALASSLGVGISLALLKEFYIGGITSPTQLAELVQQDSAAPVPASYETNANRMSIADGIVDAPLSSYSESIRKLRATIDQKLRATGPAGPTAANPQAGAPANGRVILVTSSLPDEGKTTASLALARTYALSGRKTLLIDADMRKPSVHRHLGHDPQTGFVDFLMDRADADMAGSFYARDPASPLAVIMGAARSTFPTDQLLASARFQHLLEQAREVYDVIIIDSPPLLPVVDARYLAPHADAVVFLVKWASTNQGDIRSAVEPLTEAMAPGTALVPVLNHVPEALGKSRYNGYSGYSAAT